MVLADRTSWVVKWRLLKLALNSLLAFFLTTTTWAKSGDIDSSRKSPRVTSLELNKFFALV